MRQETMRFMEKIGYRFRNPALLENALTHSSYANEGHHGMESNERLEFLGIRCWGLLRRGISLKRRPARRMLTKLRAALVCEKALCSYAQLLGLGAYLLLGKGEQRSGG